MARYIDIVIQKHKAARAGLHFDLRLKYPYKDLLASWALPRTRVPEKTGDKVLAVRTSDHPMEWLKFEGRIPSGQGGAGTVKIVQSGKVELFIWTKKIITFYANGPILDGKYALIFMKRTSKQSDWILLKAKEKKE